MLFFLHCANRLSAARGGDVAQLFRASDRHASDAGSIPRCGKEFFSQSQLSVQTLLRVSVQPPCAIACINICARVKDPKHWQPYFLFFSLFLHMKIPHALIEIGSAALAAAVALPR